MGMIRRTHVLAAILAVFMLLPASHRVEAAGLNTNVALSPPEGGTIVRVQWRYSELSDDPTAADREAALSINPITVVHGLTADLSLLTTVPIVHREIDIGFNGSQVEDTGVADIPLLAKYRFHQHDEPGVTTRWAAIAGVELPTFDEPFSSESLDPVIGTVWTHQRRDWWIDWDVLYQFNTGGGLDRDDRLRGDVALSYRLLGGENQTLGAWGLYGVGEINADYLTDGSTRVFASPGIQFITPRWILEAGVQLPVHQDLAAPRLETGYTAVVSLRFQF